MIRRLSLVFGILMLLLTGCDKTTDGKWMVYEETVCYPYWVHTSNDNKTKDQLESFLKDDGIIPLKIRVLGEREITCEACACLTGKRYEVLVDKSQIGYMNYWGFEIK